MMPILSSKALGELIRRDEKILDALQMARFILAANDVVIDPALRVVRAKYAVDEARAVVEAALKMLEPLRS